MKTLLFFIITFFSFELYSQTISVTGTVTSSDDGMPIPGVSVVAKGTSNGVATDVDGKYEIKITSNDNTLVFSSVGFKTQEIIISGRTKIDVVLHSENVQVEELVVTALGISRNQKKLGYTSGIIIRGNNSFNPQIEDYESYAKINENEFKKVKDEPLSTFSIDVDKASWSNVRRFLNSGQKPPVDAVRIEEMINYFNYNYPEPETEHPYRISTELGECPWEKHHLLMHIGLQGKKVATENLPASNLVFLLDVSGSMSDDNKLPLLKSAVKILVNNLRKQDKVAIVVYAGAAGLVLPSTEGNRKEKIIEAIESLGAGGSTAGGAGIKLAYQVAADNFIEGGNNRIILATDGDFNVGASSDDDMETLIEEKRKSGVFLTCLGFGMGNYKDSKIEKLANKGNGNYAYIDNIQEANRVFGKEFGGTLFTIAKDVKLQVEFNPMLADAYRLIGYENRMLNKEDFKDDTKDAGEMGSGHSVTAIYEIIPKGAISSFEKEVDSLKYQTINVSEVGKMGKEIATIKTRYKLPNNYKSIPFEIPVVYDPKKFDDVSDNYNFSVSVAMFGMLLRDSKFKGNTSKSQIIDLARKSRGEDPDGYKAEFIRLVDSYDDSKSTSSKEKED